MTCPRCQADNPAGIRFCGQCGTPVSAMCPACGAANPPNHRFCGQCATALAGPQRFLSPESYTPRHLAEKILTSKSALEGERKQVTVLFADLRGSLELLAGRDPEEAQRLLDPVLEHMIEAVHRYEGTVNQVLGDGIMALFGAPVAHEDHAVRACYAALRMQEALKRYARETSADEVPARIRVGLNSGEVVVRTIGSDLRMDYTAVGQTTHLAARLEQMADPGTILLAPGTWQLAEGYVDVQTRGPLPIKGLTDPVEVFELVGAGAVRSRLHAAAARGLTSFVGRDIELDQLQQALDLAKAGHGQVVAMVGEPGVGKSRLCWEFTHSRGAERWLLLEGSAASYGKGTAYLPIIELLKRYFDVEARDDTRMVRKKVHAKVLALDRQLEPVLPAVLSLLGVPVDDAAWERLDPPRRRQRTLDSVKHLLLRQSQAQPLMLLFEDLHWIDTETQAWLDSLVESLPASPLLLIASYRPEYQHGWGSKTYYRQLRIDPLPLESAGSLLVELLGTDAGLEPLKRVLIERTEGNPLFLEESVRTLVETQALLGERGRYRLEEDVESIQMPPTVQAILAARIDRLLPEDKRLLQAASVVGKDVPVALLQAVAETPDEELRQALIRLRSAEFLYEARVFPTLEYTFKHALTQDVAYGSVLDERKTALHAAVVASVERLEPDLVAHHVDLLAHHAVRGRVWDKAVSYLRQGGRQGMASGAIAESASKYEQALALLPHLDPGPETLRRAIDVRLDLSVPLSLMGRIKRLMELQLEAEPLARELGDEPTLGWIAQRLAAYGWFPGRYRDGVAQAERALTIAEEIGDVRLQVASKYALGMNHMALGDYRPAIEAFVDIVDGPDAPVAHEVPGMNVPVYWGSCAWLAFCLSTTGDFERVAFYGDPTLKGPDLDPIAEAMLASFFPGQHMIKGEFAQALVLSDRAVELCRTRNVPVWLAQSFSLRGLVLAWLGRADEALGELERGVGLYEQFGIESHRSTFHWRWAEGLLLAGKVEQARRPAHQAIELAVGLGEKGNEAQARAVLADIACVGDPPREAARLAHEALEACAALGMRPAAARCHLSLGTLYRRTGEEAQAREHLSTAAKMFGEMHMRYWGQRTEAETRGLSRLRGA
ncbi:MAG TPA: adenylate/guanylate cyclase domain-containing protein [Methylomirabilota bacterium]|nr:adenylate/guanylate cyclase domain-containing protein [Methylomirabilota bacterium]